MNDDCDEHYETEKIKEDFDNIQPLLNKDGHLVYEPTEGNLNLNIDPKNEKENSNNRFNRNFNPKTRRYFGSYYKYPCQRCGDHSHNVYCSKPSYLITCIACGSDNHLFNHCPRKICSKCSSNEHSSEECKDTPIIYCEKCKFSGHTQENCLYFIPGEIIDTKNSICMVCGKLGHICCQELQSLDVTYIDPPEEKIEKVQKNEKKIEIVPEDYYDSDDDYSINPLISAFKHSKPITLNELRNQMQRDITNSYPNTKEISCPSCGEFHPPEECLNDIDVFPNRLKIQVIEDLNKSKIKDHSKTKKNKKAQFYSFWIIFR